MTTTWKRLGQVAVAANTDTDAYTVPAATQTLATVRVCNRGGTATTFRVAQRALGAAIANQHYHAFDTGIQPNQTIDVPSIVLTATDVITCRDGAGTCSFNVLGQEIT